MSETQSALTFGDLRAANMARLPLFKNRRGEPANSEPDGSDWCLAQWCNAVCGELGETANLIKKIERGDMTLEEARIELGKEIADVQTYLDILAFRAGVDLGAATIDKFNEVSVRVGCDVRLETSSALTRATEAEKRAEKAERESREQQKIADNVQRSNVKYAADLAEAERERDEAKADIINAVKCAKEYDLEGPWVLNTASEAVWILGQGQLGVEAARKDWMAEAEKIATALDSLAAENKRLRETLEWIGHFPDEYLRQMSTGTTLHIDMAGQARAALSSQPAVPAAPPESRVLKLVGSDPGFEEAIRQASRSPAAPPSADADECPKCVKARQAAQAEWDAGGSPPSLPVKCPHGWLPSVDPTESEAQS